MNGWMDKVGRARRSRPADERMGGGETPTPAPLPPALGPLAGSGPGPHLSTEHTFSYLHPCRGGSQVRWGLGLSELPFKYLPWGLDEEREGRASWQAGLSWAHSKNTSLGSAKGSGPPSKPPGVPVLYLGSAQWDRSQHFGVTRVRQAGEKRTTVRRRRQSGL